MLNLAARPSLAAAHDEAVARAAAAGRGGAMPSAAQSAFASAWQRWRPWDAGSRLEKAGQDLLAALPAEGHATTSATAWNWSYQLSAGPGSAGPGSGNSIDEALAVTGQVDCVRFDPRRGCLVVSEYVAGGLPRSAAAGKRRLRRNTTLLIGALAASRAVAGGTLFASEALSDAGVAVEQVSLRIFFFFFVLLPY